MWFGFEEAVLHEVHMDFVVGIVEFRIAHAPLYARHDGDPYATTRRDRILSFALTYDALRLDFERRPECVISGTVDGQSRPSVACLGEDDQFQGREGADAQFVLRFSSHVGELAARGRWSTPPRRRTSPPSSGRAAGEGPAVDVLAGALWRPGSGMIETAYGVEAPGTVVARRVDRLRLRARSGMPTEATFGELLRTRPPDGDPAVPSCRRAREEEA